MDIRTDNDFFEHAINFVKNYVNESLDKSKPMPDSIPEHKVFISQYDKTFLDHKAMLTSTWATGMLFIVAYDGREEELYLTVYKGVDNRRIK